MADFTKTVELIFGGRDNVTPTVRSITKELDSFQTGVEKIAAPLADTADFVVKLDLALAALGATVIGFSINEAVKLESAQLDLQKVLSDSEGSVDQYEERIKNLALTYGVFQTDVTASVAEFKQANFDISESFLLVEDALIATKISELSAQEASELLKQTIKGFGFEVDQSRVILDTWNETSNNFNTKTREIATALAQVSGVADLAGLSLDQTTALLVPMIEVFGSGSEAATALRTGLLKVADDSAPVAEALQKLGVSQTNVNGTFKSAGEIFFEVIANLGKLTEAEQLHVVQQLVGINQSDKLVQTFTNQNKITEILTVLTDKAGSAQRELAIRMEATEVAIERLRVAFNSTASAIGTEFLNSTKGVSSALAEVFLAVQEGLDAGAFDELFAELNKFGAGLESTLRSIAENLPGALQSDEVQAAIGEFLDAFGRLGDTIGSLFGNVDLTTAQGLEDALARLVNIGTSLVNITDGLVASFKPLFDALGAGIGGFSDLDDSTQSLIGNFLGLGKQVDILSPIFSNLLGVVGGVAQVLNTIFTAVLVGKVTNLTGAVTLLGDAFKLIPVVAVGAMAFELTKWADINDRLIPGVDTLGTKIFEWTHRTDEASKSTAVFVNLFPELGKNIDEYGDAARSAADDTGTLNTAGTSLEEQMKRMGLAADGTKLQLDGLAEETTAAGDSTAQWIKTIVDGVPTFTDAGTAISQSFKSTGDEAEEAAKKTDEYQLKLLELASDERIKTIEATVSLNIAQLESDTEIAVGLIDSLTATITSSADVLNGLFDLFGDADRFDQLGIERLIDREFKIRESAAEKQNELIDAQIDMLRTRTEALSNGDSLITINADGLAPELEAFMMKVLERIQIRASEDRSLYLLGLPA